MATLLAQPFSTVGESLADAATRFPSREAIVMGVERFTHRQVLEYARQYAAGLSGIGVRAGDHVGILMPNCIEYLWLFYGCALLGARPVHFNARYKRDELRYVVADSDIRWLFTSSLQSEFNEFERMLTDIYPSLGEWQLGRSLNLADAPMLKGVFMFHGRSACGWPEEADFFAAAGGESFSVNSDPEQIGLIMYTSGTTSNPKACLLSHRCLEFTGHAMAKRWLINQNDRIWDPLPFFHVSTILPLTATRVTGACFHAMQRFSGDQGIEEILRERPTILFTAFPAITNELISHARFDANKMTQVRIMNNVGPPELLRRFHQALPHVIHVSAFGLTEGGGVVSFHELSDSADERLETCGRPFEGAEVRVVDPDTLEPLPPETRGELQIRGPLLFSGYYKDEAKTLATLLSDGWLRTGDLGALTEEGRIRYLGRIKDMLKVGGENVAAIEIEGHLCSHPAVKAAQVIGVPDDRLQEVAAAFVELHPGQQVDAETLVRHCVGRIASFKIPRYVGFVTEWPMSATKVQKFQLRNQLANATRVEPSLLK